MRVDVFISMRSDTTNVYPHVLTRVFLRVYTHVCTCPVYTHVYTCVYICSTRLSTCLYTCMSTYLHTCISTYPITCFNQADSLVHCRTHFYISQASPRTIARAHTRMHTRTPRTHAWAQWLGLAMRNQGDAAAVCELTVVPTPIMRCRGRIPLQLRAYPRPAARTMATPIRKPS